MKLPRTEKMRTTPDVDKKSKENSHSRNHGTEMNEDKSLNSTEKKTRHLKKHVCGKKQSQHLAQVDNVARARR